MFMLLSMFIPCLYSLLSSIIRKTIEFVNFTIQKEDRDSIQIKVLHSKPKDEQARLILEKSERQTRIKRFG